MGDSLSEAPPDRRGLFCAPGWRCANNARMDEPAQRDRYHRQRLLAGVGDQGQERLRASTAIVIGVGALGTVSADALCRAGVGTLRLVDRDVVERTNLQRQSLYEERDVGYPKAEAARDRLARTNSDVALEAHAKHLDAPNALELIDGCAVVVDGTDNFETRFLVNDACVKLGIPYIYAGVVGTSGTGGVILPGETGCLRCVLREAPAPMSVETCDTSGVLGPLAWMVASWQACEALKILTGNPDRVSKGLRSFDAWSPEASVRSLAGALSRDPACPCCAHGRYAYLERGAMSEATVLCGRGAVQVTPGRAISWDLEALAARMGSAGDAERAGSSVRADIDGFELTVFADGRAIVRGADDVEHARALYDRYVGA